MRQQDISNQLQQCISRGQRIELVWFDELGVIFYRNVSLCMTSLKWRPSAMNLSAFVAFPYIVMQGSGTIPKFPE